MWFDDHSGELTELMPGKLSKDPSTGTRLIKPTATGKNPLFKDGEREKYIHIISGNQNRESVFLSLLNWPEQEEETVNLQNNSNDRPANQNHKHSSQKETGGFKFVSLEEEPEGPLQADDKGQAWYEQNLHRGKKALGQCFSVL